MAVDWFYMRAGQIAGPLTAAQLREHALARKIAPADHVRQGGDGNWVSAAKVKGLFDPPSAEPLRPVVPPPPHPAAQEALPVPQRPPSRQPTPAGAPRGPSVPLGWVVAGVVALLAVFGVVLLLQQDYGPRGSTPGYTPSGGGGYTAPINHGRSNNSAKAESLRFQITQLQEDQRRIERKIEDIEAEQRRESDKLRNSKTSGVDGIADALRYQRESEGRVRLKNSYYEDLSKLRKQIAAKKKELGDAER